MGRSTNARVLSPGDPLFRAGTESVLCAASIEQARIVCRFVRAALGENAGYRYVDSATRVAIRRTTKRHVVSLLDKSLQAGHSGHHDFRINYRPQGEPVALHP